MKVKGVWSHVAEDLESQSTESALHLLKQQEGDKTRSLLRTIRRKIRVALRKEPKRGGTAQRMY